MKYLLIAFLAISAFRIQPCKCKLEAKYFLNGKIARHYIFDSVTTLQLKDAIQLKYRGDSFVMNGVIYKTLIK